MTERQDDLKRAGAAVDRKQRLAAELRANLLKRKALARQRSGRDGAVGDKSGGGSDEQA